MLRIRSQPVPSKKQKQEIGLEDSPDDSRACGFRLSAAAPFFWAPPQVGRTGPFKAVPFSDVPLEEVWKRGLRVEKKKARKSTVPLPEATGLSVVWASSTDRNAEQQTNTTTYQQRRNQQGDRCCDRCYDCDKSFTIFDTHSYVGRIGNYSVFIVILICVCVCV